MFESEKLISKSAYQKYYAAHEQKKFQEFAMDVIMSNRKTKRRYLMSKRDIFDTHRQAWEQKIPVKMQKKINSDGHRPLSEFVTHTAKLTPQDVLTIVEKINSGVSSCVIAKEYNVCDTTISHIKYGKTWWKLTGIGRKN